MSYYRIGASQDTSDSPVVGKKEHGALGIGIALGLLALAYGSAPGTRSWFKTGRLPR